ncbi:peptidyl-tRNA hydrolase ICT1, mitochondrial [Thrips palmi]|uniref:Large ribosomal subunit protein mL62 n=1 Tax=Thrips palmi TaxID=161013 RepID=A0A6P8YYL8_THRPL|nr:peptidyl-tRNA hydrolase ICT1, mitochondrial [Thrips palmi]
MNTSLRCFRFLQNQLWHSGKCLNVYRCMSFESSISLKSLYPTSNLAIKTPSVSQIPPKEGQRFSGFIPIEKLKITASRSSGPGGQHANKVSSKVDVRFRIDDAEWLEPELREKIKSQFQSRITSDGYLFVTSDRTRSKQLNIANCMEKLRDIIWKSEGPEVVELSEEDKILQLKQQEAANRERLKKKRMRSFDKQSRRPDDRYID